MQLDIICKVALGVLPMLGDLQLMMLIPLYCMSILAADVSHCVSGCALPSTPQNVIIKESSDLDIVYQCSAGFYLQSGNLKRHCNEVDGSSDKWNGSAPMCIDTQCSEPPEIFGASKIITYLHTDGIYTVSSEITYTCEADYIFPDNSLSKTIICQDDATWSDIDILSSCISFGCGDLPEIPYASSIKTDINTAVYICDDFYHFSTGQRSKTVICHNTTFTWSKVNDECILNVNAVIKKSAQFLLNGKKKRMAKSGDMLKETVARSMVDCANTCLHDYSCDAYNFYDGTGTNNGICRAFSNTGGMLNETEARSEVDCADICLHDNRCYTYNFYNGIDTNNGNCRVFSGNSYSMDLQNDNHWLYFENKEFEYSFF